MSCRQQTLLEYLQIPDPVLNVTPCSTGGNTTQTAYDKPYEIAEWKDFNFETLSSIYGGVLYKVLIQSFNLKDHTDIDDVPFREIWDEDSLQCLLSIWTQSVVSDALAHSQPCLPNLQQFVLMVKGGQVPSPKPKKKKGIKTTEERNWKPDWGCKIKSSWPKLTAGDAGSEPSLLPGDSKLSSKWSSSEIEIGIVNYRWGKRGSLSPLRQIYTYCLKHNRRYGYLITDRELVVIRIRFLEDSKKNSTTTPQTTDALRDRAYGAGVLEFKAIPWQSEPMDTMTTAGRLTMNMALWWLHLMATGNTNIGADYGNLKDAVWAPLVRNRTSLSSLRPELIKVCPFFRSNGDYVFET